MSSKINFLKSILNRFLSLRIKVFICQRSHLFFAFLLCVFSVMISFQSQAADSSEWSSCPKELLLQTSLDNQVQVTLPEININLLTWKCEKMDSAGVKGIAAFNCYLKNSKKISGGEIMIGSNTYTISLIPNEIWPIPMEKDLNGQSVKWSDIPKNHFLTLKLEEKTLGSEYSTVLSLYPDHARISVGVTGFPGKVLSYY